MKCGRPAPGIAFYQLLIFAATTVFLLPQSLSAAPAYVQGNSAVPQTPQTTVPVTYTAAQTAGNLNVVIVGWNDTANSVVSISDTRLNTYLLAVGPTKRTAALSQSIYYAKNIAGGTNTVTVKFSGSANYPDIRILEYSGLDAFNPFDVAIGASGSSTTSSAGTITTTSASEVLIAGNTVTSITTGAGTGFTKRLLTARMETSPKTES